MNSIALLSLHGCPVARLGERDTGGMNVYLLQVARELGQDGIKVDVFTRSHDPADLASAPARVSEVSKSPGSSGDERSVIWKASRNESPGSNPDGPHLS